MVAPLKIDTTREMEIYSREDDKAHNQHGFDDEDDEDQDDDPFEHQSSSPSIHEDEIDFDYVYAYKTFVATEKGQANAVKGDAMVLLNDSNSYWWLVRLVKDSSVGFLPAEHVETPWERLARLNKHRNGELASPAHDSHGFAAFFGEKEGKGNNPFNKIFKKKEKAKSVAFNGNPTYVSASEYEYSDGYEGEEDDDDEYEDHNAEEEEEQEVEEDDTESVVRHLEKSKPGQVDPELDHFEPHTAPQPVLSPDLDSAPAPLVVSKVRKNPPANLTVDTSMRSGPPNVIVHSNPNHPNAQSHSSWDQHASSEEEGQTEEPVGEESGISEESVIITSSRPANASSAAAAAAAAVSAAPHSVAERTSSQGSVASYAPADHRLSVSSQNSDNSVISQSSGKKRFSLLRTKSSVDNLQRSSSSGSGRFVGLFKRKSKDSMKKKDLEPVQSPVSSVHSAASAPHSIDQGDLASIDEKDENNGAVRQGTTRKGSYSSVSSVRSSHSQQQSSPMQSRIPIHSVAPLAPRGNRPMSQPPAPVTLKSTPLHHSHSLGSSPATPTYQAHNSGQAPGHSGLGSGPPHSSIHTTNGHGGHMPGQAPGHASLGPMPAYAPGQSGKGPGHHPNHHSSMQFPNPGYTPGQAPGHSSMGHLNQMKSFQGPPQKGPGNGSHDFGPQLMNGQMKKRLDGPQHGPQHGPPHHQNGTHPQYSQYPQQPRQQHNGPGNPPDHEEHSRGITQNIDSTLSDHSYHGNGHEHFPERLDSRHDFPPRQQQQHHPASSAARAHPDLPRSLSPERQVGRMTPEERPLHILRDQTPTGFADVSPLKTFNREYGSTSTLGSERGLPPVSPIKTVSSGLVESPTSQIPTPSKASFHNEHGDQVDHWAAALDSDDHYVERLDSIKAVPSAVPGPPTSMDGNPFGVHDPRTNTAAPPWPTIVTDRDVGEDVEIESIGTDASSTPEGDMHQSSHLEVSDRERTPSVVSSFDDDLETPTVAVAKHMSLTPQMAGLETSEFLGRFTPDGNDRTPQLEGAGDTDVGDSTLTRAPVAHFGAPSAPTPVAPLANHRTNVVGQMHGNMSTQSVQSYTTAHNAFSSTSLASSFSTSSLLDGYEQRSEETVDESPVSELAEAPGFETKSSSGLPVNHERGGSDGSAGTIRRVPINKAKRYSTTLHPDIAHVYRGTNDRLNTLNDKVDMLLRHLS